MVLAYYPKINFWTNDVILLIIYKDCLSPGTEFQSLINNIVTRSDKNTRRSG